MMDSPYQTPAEPAKPFSDGNSAALFEPFYRRRMWMRVLGVPLIIVGALYSITIIGAIVGIPMIFAGLYLVQAAGHFEGGYGGNTARFYEGADKLSLAVQLGGIVVIIMAVFMVLYLAFIFLLIGIGAASTINSGGM